MSRWILALLGGFSVGATAQPHITAKPQITARPRITATLAVVSKQDALLQLFDARTGALQREYPLGFLPHEVLISRRGGYIAVTNYGKDHVRSQAPTNVPGRTLTLVRDGIATTHELDTAACAPHGLAESADGRRLYVTCEAQEKLIVFDVMKGRVLRELPTGQAQSHMVVVSADESRAYTSNFAAGSVTAIDLRSGQILARIPVGPGTEGLSLAPDGRSVYASSVLGGFIAKIDTASLKVTATATTPRSPVRVLPTPDGRRLIVNSSADGMLSVYREADLSLERSLAVGRQPIGLAVPSNRTAFVAAMLDHEIVEVDLDSGRVVKRFTSAHKPDGIDMIPENPDQHGESR